MHKHFLGLNFIFACCIFLIIFGYVSSPLTETKIIFVKPDIRVSNLTSPRDVMLTTSGNRLNSLFFFKQLTEIFKTKMKRFWFNLRVIFPQQIDLQFFFVLDMVIALFFIFYQTSRKNSGTDASNLIRLYC